MAPLPTRNDLKKELVARGFEPYRTLPDAVVLADRVRDNLIMDSGVSVGVGDALFVRVVFHAEAMAFPGETVEELVARARALAKPLLERGYHEIGVSTLPIRDPGDRTQTLDTWHQVTFELSVGSFEAVLDELGVTLALEKAAGPSPR